MVYIASFVCAVLAVGFLFLAKAIGFDTYQRTVDPYASFQVQLDLITWSVIAVACAFTALPLWGIVGVALSKAREKKEEFVRRTVIASRKSWHYRLNTWMNFGDVPPERCSECEYWARLCNGLFAGQVATLILGIFIAAIMALGWLTGLKPILSGTPWQKKWYDAPNIFESERQWKGPITLGLLLLGGLAAGLAISGAGHALVQAGQGAHWASVGKWTAVGVGSAFMGVTALLLCPRIWRHALQPIFSLVTARAIGVCRPMEFVD
jgi:hypothetical protein